MMVKKRVNNQTLEADDRRCHHSGPGFLLMVNQRQQGSPAVLVPLVMCVHGMEMGHGMWIN